MNKIRFCENGAFKQIAYNNVIHYDVDADLFDKFKNIYEENEDLKHQLEQCEQKISKAIDYIKNNMLYKYKYDGEELFEVITSEYAKRDLLKILGEDNENV